MGGFPFLVALGRLGVAPVDEDGTPAGMLVGWFAFGGALGLRKMTEVGEGPFVVEVVVTHQSSTRGHTQVQRRRRSIPWYVDAGPASHEPAHARPSPRSGQDRKLGRVVDLPATRAQRAQDAAGRQPSVSSFACQRVLRHTDT